MKDRSLLLGCACFSLHLDAWATPSIESIGLPKAVGTIISMTSSDDGALWLLDERANLLRYQNGTFTFVERNLCGGSRGVREPKMREATPIVLHSRHGKPYVEVRAWREGAANGYLGFFPIVAGRATQCQRGYPLYGAYDVYGSDGHDVWISDPDHPRYSFTGQPVVTPASSLTEGALAAESPFRVYRVGAEAARFNGLDWKPLPAPPFEIRALASHGKELVGLGGSVLKETFEAGGASSDKAYAKAAWFDGTKWSELSLPPGAMLSRVAHAGRFWLLGKGSWFYFDVNALQPVPPPVAHLHSISSGMDGTLWAAGTNASAAHPSPMVLQRINVPNPNPPAKLDWDTLRPRSAPNPPQNTCSEPNRNPLPLDARFMARKLIDKPVLDLVPGRRGHVYVALEDGAVQDCTNARCASLGQPRISTPSRHWQSSFNSLSVTPNGDVLWFGISTDGFDATTAMEGAVSRTYVYRGRWQPVPEVDKILNHVGDLAVGTTRRSPPVACGTEVCAVYDQGRWRSQQWSCHNRATSLTRFGNEYFAATNYPENQPPCATKSGRDALQSLPSHFRALEGRSLDDYWYALGTQVVHVEAGIGTERLDSPVGEVASLVAGVPGQLWIAGAAGLAHWVDGLLVAVDAWQAPANVVEADPNHTWVGGAEGLAVLERREPVVAPAPLPLVRDLAPPIVGEIVLTATPFEVQPSRLPCDPPTVSVAQLVDVLLVDRSVNDTDSGVIVRGSKAPRLGVQRGARVMLDGDLPNARYIAFDRRGVETWLLGTDCVDGLPLVVHRDEKANHLRSTGPFAALGIAATGPNEAWAFGEQGRVLHLVATSTTRYQLPDEPALRAVGVRSTNDVWLVGDDSTILHWDGHRLTRIPIANLERDLAFDTAAFNEAGRLVIAGPSGSFVVVP